MKNVLLALGTTLVLAACGAQPNASATLAGSTPAEKLAAKIAHVSCVKYAEPERTVGIPEDPNFHSSETGNVMVAVKDGYSVAQCSKQIKAKVRHVKVVETLDTLKLILVKGA